MRALRERHAHGDRSFPFEVFEQQSLADQQICYLHWHDETEWIYIAEGAVEVLVDGRPIRVEADEMLAVDSRVLHEVDAVDACRQYACVFDRQLLAFALSDFVSWQYINPYIEGKTTIASPVPCAGTGIGEAFADIARSCQEQPPAFQLEVKLSLLKIFQALIQGGHIVDRGTAAHRLEALENVLRYIEEHYAEHITSSTLAELAGYNPQYFSRAFKRMTGLTPTDYINRHRIEHACELLLDPDRSILDISVACGFSSTSYFIKKFKELKGSSPRRYRALLEDNSTTWSEYYSTLGPGR